MIGYRRAQGLATFKPGDPSSGFYNDLRVVTEPYASSDEARTALDCALWERRLVNPVSVAQVGLGAWQRWRDAARESSWLEVVGDAAEWIAANLEPSGGLPYLFDMPHTYPLSAPWYSAMAQGEAVSLLVRSAVSLQRAEYFEAATRAAKPLLDPASGLVSHTMDGPVLEEYPTQPPSHVLNGWVFALWGLYDLASAGHTSREAAAAASQFDSGATALAARLRLYETCRGWSRYDLYPHRISHVASPFYQRLHVAQLRAMAILRPDLDEFASRADRWEAALGSVPSVTISLARKAAFRMLRPRTSIARPA